MQEPQQQQIWSDSRLVSSSVNATTETSIGSLNVPKNQAWLLTSLWGAHAQKGSYRMEIDSLPGMAGRYICNSDDPDTIGSATGSASLNNLNFVVNGPATISFFGTPANAGASDFQIQLQCQITQQSG
tara:strand:+ start:29 stop:412 length:384 start_codon:yes stop_codon:yes gene_type:complete